MKTGEDSPESGLYASECCGLEVEFQKGKCFWRCPKCHALCNWETVEPIDYERDIAA